MGAVSTFAFIMAGRSGGDVRREVSEIQLGMTLGQVLGPAAGALTAARLGFRLSFLLSSAMLGLCRVAGGLGRARGPRTGRERAGAGGHGVAARDRDGVPPGPRVPDAGLLPHGDPAASVAAPRRALPLHARGRGTGAARGRARDGARHDGGAPRGRGLRRPPGGAVAPRVLVALPRRALAGDERVDLRRHPLRAGAVHRAGLPARRRGDRAPRLGSRPSAS